MNSIRRNVVNFSTQAQDASDAEAVRLDAQPVAFDDSSAAQSNRPDSSDFLSVTVENEEVPNKYSGKQFVMASLRAPKFETGQAKRPSLRLIAVLDRSGSMQAECRMTNVKETMEFLVSRVLRPEDDFAIVTYDHSVEVPLALTRADKQGIAKALAAVKTLSPRGTTNLSGGLFKGLELVQGATDKDVTAVLLFTDGLANEGVQDSATICRLVESLCASAQQTPSVFTFGFGKDHNEDMLRGIAQVAHGTYYFIKGKDDIPQAFGDCFGGLTSVVAQNIKLKIEPAAEDVVVTKVHAARPARPLENGGFEVDLGDLYSEEHRDILFEIEVPATPVCTDLVPVARLTCTCMNVMTASSEVHKSVASVVRPKVSACSPSLLIDMHRNRIDVVHAIELATAAADEGNLAKGRNILDGARKAVCSSRSADSELSISLLRDIDQILSGMVEKEKYRKFGNKMSKARMMSHLQQRSNHSCYADYEEEDYNDSNDPYLTSCKLAMKSNMRNVGL
jgi:hypothetical protein